MIDTIDLTEKILTKHGLCGMKDCTVLVRENQLYSLTVELGGNYYSSEDYNYFMEDAKVRNIKIIIVPDGGKL